MVKKKYLLFWGIILLFISWSPLLLADEDNNGTQVLDDMLELNWDDDDPLDESWLEEDTFEQGATRAEDLNAVILQIMAPLFTKPIWRKTFKPPARDVLYHLSLSRAVTSDKRGFFYMPFYNKTDETTLFFTDQASLELNEEVLGNLIEMGGKFAGLDLDFEATKHIISLTKTLVIEERKSGGILAFHFPIGPFFVRLDSSILVNERNFFADKKVQNEVDEFFRNLFGEPIAGVFDVKREFARIGVGIGDTRLRLGLTPLDHSRIKSSVGLTIILPTASRLLLDGRYKKPRKTEINNLLDPLINNMRRVLLNPPLGNNGHFGAGGFVNVTIPLYRNDLLLRVNLSYDKFTACRSSLKKFITSKQNRPIMERATVTPEEVGRVNTNEILDDFKRQFLIPEMFAVRVNPGDVFMATLVLDGKYNYWRLRGGYNFYHRQREVLRRLYDSDVPIQSLRTEDVVAPGALQHKGLFEVGYERCIGRTSMSFALGGDYSFSGKGIGKDWTVHGRIGIAL